MKRKTKKTKGPGAPDKTFLERMWAGIAPYGALIVVCLAIPLVILAIKHRGADDELKAAVGRRAGPSFSLMPKTPLGGNSIKIVANKKGSKEDSYSYRWWLNGTLVEGLSKDILPGASLKKGDEVRVAALDKRGNVVATKEATVANAIPVLKKIRFEPLPLDRNHDLRVTVEATDLDDDEVTYEYAWLVNEEEIMGESEPVLSRTNYNRGDKVQVMVNMSDGYASRPILSAPVLVMNSPPEIVSKPPAMVAEGTYTYKVEAKDSEGDRLQYSLGGNPPPGMKINPDMGLVTWEAKMPKKPVSYAYQVIVKDGLDGRCVQNIFLEFK